MTTTPLRALTMAVALLSLSGCALQPPSGVTDTEARDRFHAVIDETQRLLGGSWQVQDDPTPRECVIPLWVTGERYPALRTGPEPRDVQDAADRVEQAWRDQGVSVERSVVGEVIELQGESADGELFLFRVSESGMTLQGESECRPVDA